MRIEIQTSDIMLTETDLYVAVNCAAERAGRTLGRQLRQAGDVFDNRSAWG